MDNDPELDPIRKEVDEDALLEDLAEEFMNAIQMAHSPVPRNSATT